jgi:hypothetical protein
VNAAIDQWYQRRQRDAEGEFYQKVARQGPRNDMSDTTQGLYACTADGKLLGFTNNRSPGRVKEMLRKALEDFKPADAPAIEAGKPDPEFDRRPPEGGVVVRVSSKVLGGYPEGEGRRLGAMRASLGRDNLWVRKDEAETLGKGILPESLPRRIARFHLIDNTRGEPPMWRAEEIRVLDLKLVEGRLSGTVRLETARGDRGFQGELLGFVESKDGTLTRFDLVARGQFWGEGRYTGGAPPGKFPFAVAFTRSSGDDETDKVPPQGAKGWLKGYLQ